MTTTRGVERRVFGGRRGLRLLFLVAGLGAGASALLAQQSDTTRNPLANNADAVASGRVLYERTCQTCHAPAGQGDRGPALNTGRFVHGSADGDLFHAVRAGFPGTQMPPFAALADEQIWQLVTYIRSLTPTAGTPAPVTVTVRTKDGRELRGVRLNEDTFSLQLTDDTGAWHFFDKTTQEAYRVDPGRVTPARLEKAAAEPQNWLMSAESIKVTNSVAVIAFIFISLVRKERQHFSSTRACGRPNASS